MPELVAGLVQHPAVAPGHELAFRVRVGEVDDVSAQAVLAAEGAHGGLERTEAQAEGRLLLVGQRLAVEDQHGVLVEGVGDAGEGRVVERPGEVHAADLRPEQRVDGGDGQRARGNSHGVLLACDSIRQQPANSSEFS